MSKSGYVTKKMISRSVAYEGNTDGLARLMRRAQNGEKLTLCFLGGSITQGSLSSVPEKCYAYLVYSWFVEKFAGADFKYVNAGIGGTTSQFGVARLSENVIPYKPDFCMIEFSVNDGANQYYRESYEGLVRRVSGLSSKPAMLIMNNLFYDTGVNTQVEHNEIGKAYDITCISVRDAVRPEIESGKITRTDISPDGLHPNDAGHMILAELVTSYLERIYTDCIENGKPETTVAKRGKGTVTVNALEHLHRTQNRPVIVECRGFEADHSKKRGIWDLFRHGWTAEKTGDSIRFEFTGSELAVQYRKTIDRPAPIAVAVIDNDEEHPIVLDANFEENWGNHLHVDTLMYHGCVIDPAIVHHGRVQFGEPSREEAEMEAKLSRLADTVPRRSRHTVEIRIIETHENDRTPFYLVSFMTA